MLIPIGMLTSKVFLLKLLAILISEMGNMRINSLTFTPQSDRIYSEKKFYTYGSSNVVYSFWRYRRDRNGIILRFILSESLHNLTIFTSLNKAEILRKPRFLLIQLS